MVANLFDKDARAVEQIDSQRTPERKAKLGKLDGEGGVVLAQQGHVEQARGDERGDHPDGVEAHHGAGAQAEELADDGAVRDEGGYDHGVERQPRGAGHEGRNQNGGEAVAARGDGARGHDGGHGTGVSRQQRQKRAAAEAERYMVRSAMTAARAM